MEKITGLEFGIVDTVLVEDGKCMARVRIPERGDIVSPPMYVLQQGTRETKAFWVPKVNEQVAFIRRDDGAAGVILGAFYSTRDQTDADLNAEGQTGTVFADGTSVIYDENTGELTIDSVGKVIVTAADEISATVGTCEVKLTSTEAIMKKGTTQVKVAAKVNIETAAGSLFAVIDDMLTANIAETHPTAVGPSGPPVNVASYVAAKIALGLVME